MIPGSTGPGLAVLSLSAQAESHGNPWWLWIIVFAVLAAFVAFMLWWWMRGSGPEEGVEPTRHAEIPLPATSPPATEVDDLKRIEGIGPRISGVLQAAGIHTFAQLADSSSDQIREILRAENPNLLRLADPTTWPQQASLAARGEWAALEALQGELDGGRRV